MLAGGDQSVVDLFNQNKQQGEIWPYVRQMDGQIYSTLQLLLCTLTLKLQPRQRGPESDHARTTWSFKSLELPCARTQTDKQTDILDIDICQGQMRTS